MLQKMARTVFETNNVDNCARVCHGPSVAGLQRTLGSGAMTNPISDICENAQVILLVGSNPEEAHPVIGMQLRAAIARGTRLIVVDPAISDCPKRPTCTSNSSPARTSPLPTASSVSLFMTT